MTRSEEVKQRTGKEAEIVRLNEALAEQRKLRHAMSLELQKMMRYQSFLELVLDAAEEFPEITDLLSRYDTLDAAHDDLERRQTESANENEEERHKLQQFIRDKTDQVGHANVFTSVRRNCV